MYIQNSKTEEALLKPTWNMAPEGRVALYLTLRHQYEDI